MPRIIAVIDGNSLMHRAYHAVPPTMSSPEGTPTNAVFGFLAMLFKFIDTAQPDAIFCAFDVGKPKFRLELMEHYKEGRPPMDDELRQQFPVAEEVLQALAIPVVKMPGWEGDDILGTIAAKAEEREWKCLVVTGDKDANQLASEHVSIVNTKKGITDIVVYTPEKVLERYGVTPAQFPDFLGFMGDKSDNIPGVPGIGEKTATKLLQNYGSMDGVYEHLDALKGKQRENIENNRELAFLSRRVATIVRDLELPADLDLDDAAFPSYDLGAVQRVFQRYGLRTHLKKVERYAEAGGLSADGAASAGAAIVIAAESEKLLRDAQAHDFVDAACALGKDVGVAWHCADETLFGTSLRLAVAADNGIAFMEGDEAAWALRELLRSANIITGDFKALVQNVYPKDTSIAAAVDARCVARARFFDLCLAAYALDSGADGYQMEKLAERYLHASLAATDDAACALATQAEAALRLKAPLEQALAEDASKDVYQKLDAPLAPVLAEMERTGAALDTPALAKLGDYASARMDEFRTRIFAEAGREFNIDSPLQVSQLLFDELGMKPLKKTSRGYSTAAGVLTQLAEDPALSNGKPELPRLILDYREFAKLESTYIDALPRMRAGDGRVHTSFNETVTTTGRLSSSDPNLQNIPVRSEFGRHIRGCFVPLNAGERFVSADYSQIELRLLAHLSGDEHLIRAFCEGEDFHAETAARVFDVPFDEVTPQMRSRAKAVNFGIVYGQQAYGLSQSLRIPFGEAKEMIDRYFQAYPQVRSYLDKLVAQAHERGFAETMFGRKRHIPELLESNRQRRSFGERTAMNHPMQGTAADIIKMAMVEVQRRLVGEGFAAKMILQVHDELCFSVPREELDALCAMVKDAMEGVVTLSVPLVAEVNDGANWGEAH